MKKAVVTGASSMIASHLIKRLIWEGIAVTAVVRPGSAKVKNVPKSPLVKVVYLAMDALDALDDTCDAFFHFAWAGTGGGARQDKALQEENVKNTQKALEQAIKCGAKVFFTAGSQAEYGKIPYGEKLSLNTPLCPLTEYGRCKTKAAELCSKICNEAGIKHIHMRILSVYGVGDNDFTLVKSAITKMLKNEETAFTKGEQMWDYLNARDAAEAIYIAAEGAEESRTFVLGSGQCAPLKEYIKIIAEETRYKKELGFGKIEEGLSPAYLCADISELQRLGFEPKVGFREGIREILREEFGDRDES